MVCFFSIFYSSLINQNVYVDFLVDWTIELVSTLRNTIVFSMVGSLYLGLCLYTVGMVADLKAKMSAIDDSLDIREESTRILSIYVKAIHFHVSIIE